MPESESDFVPVLLSEKLHEGQKLLVQVDGNDVLLAKIGGKVYAVRNICTHGGAPLSSGKLRSYAICCEAHGAFFDMRTGKPSYPARRELITYESKVQDSWICVRRVPLDRIFPFERSKGKLPGEADSLGPTTIQK
jgi:3-phenylpropionate/trans-cinnamate dioxygenase ferredoxin component